MKNVSDIHSFSKAVPKLKMRFNGHDLSLGSGLLVLLGSDRFLITAAHNLTGRERDGRPKRDDGAVPNEVLLEGYYLRAGIRLYSGDNEPSDEERRLYALDQDRDVAIIKVTPPPQRPDLGGTPADESFLDPRDHSVLRVGIADTCFVIGYPTGIETTTPHGPTPIWKAATIASEPQHTGPDQPLLIDTWGEVGLSGGPVFMMEGSLNRLIGIYTGRRFTEGHNNEKEQSLGTVTPTEIVMALLTAAKSSLRSMDTRLG